MYAIYAAGIDRDDPLSVLGIGDVEAKPTPEEWVDVDVKAMVANDPSVMGTEIKSNIERMMLLGDYFPAWKVPRLLAEAPKLLTCEDLEDRVARTVDCIKRVYPKETDESCMYAVRETNPRPAKK